MQKIVNPSPLFLNDDGTLLNGGRIYIGTPNADPVVSPVTVFYDKEMTIVAAQPLRTIGGRIVNDQLAATSVYVAGDDFSIRISDVNGVQVDYYASIALAEGASYQPQSVDLTAIAALATTVYGRGLLTLANQAALRAATGIPDPLPLAGGQMTGPITRNGAGTHLYHMDPANSGRVYVTASGASDPTSAAGDIWIQLA